MYQWSLIVLQHYEKTKKGLKARSGACVPHVEFLELAGIAAHDVDMTRVLPSRIHLAARNNDLRRLIICNLVIAKTGVLPNIQDALQPTWHTGIKAVSDSKRSECCGSGPFYNDKHMHLRHVCSNAPKEIIVAAVIK
ncbi:unnamed protein product [Mesocestoides corti]|uniref:ANK_REP_REGION domain-containing protein n=1 Tax=Mesocestoides corti TaxID=53468 RepID=A0A0R3URE0_MESCO|nr:unnamed protein product [Mesocestoides corti]